MKLMEIYKFIKKIKKLRFLPKFIYSQFVEICRSGDFEFIAEEMYYYSNKNHQYGLLAAIEKGLILVVITIVPRSPINILEAKYYAQKCGQWRIYKYLCKY